MVLLKLQSIVTGALNYYLLLTCFTEESYTGLKKLTATSMVLTFFHV